MQTEKCTIKNLKLRLNRTYEKIKKILDITRQQAGKPRLKDNYLTAEGLPKF